MPKDIGSQHTSSQRISDEPDRLTNLDVVDSNQRQGICDKIEQSCISHEKSESEVSNQSSVKGTDKSQNMCRSKSLQQQEISFDAGLDGHDPTGKVTIGTPNDKVVDSQHQSTKPYKVQAKDIPKLRTLRSSNKIHAKCRKIWALRALSWTKPKAIIQGVWQIYRVVQIGK